jgi:hypothetical protein
MLGLVRLNVFRQEAVLRTLELFRAPLAFGSHWLPVATPIDHCGSHWLPR